jgi:cytochrome P450
MTREPESYPDPELFLPERYLDKSNGGLHDAPARDPAEFVFGFGRRVCPGRPLAMESLWIFSASILAAFDILPRVDETTGLAAPPPGTYGNGVIV